MYWNLQAILKAKPEQYILIEFSRLIREVDYVRGVLKQFGIEDVNVTEHDLRLKINTNTIEWFPKPENWPIEQVKLFQSLNDEYGSGAPPEMPCLF